MEASWTLIRNGAFDAPRSRSVVGCSGLLLLALIVILTVSPALAWSDTDAVGVDCGIFPSGEGQSAANWFSQASIQTANNDDQDCALMRVEGYYRDSGGGYHYMGHKWLGLFGPQFVVFDDVVEVGATDNICPAGYTNCNGSKARTSSDRDGWHRSRVSD